MSRKEGSPNLELQERKNSPYDSTHTPKEMGVERNCLPDWVANQ